MPILRNERHERFAQQLARGVNATQAYRNAGYADDRRAAARLAKHVDIRNRVYDIHSAREKIDHRSIERAIERTAIGKERVLIELSHIGFANMGNYIAIDEKTNAVRLRVDEITPEQMSAVKAITFEPVKVKVGEKTRLVPMIKRFELYDKRAALVDIGRELGMFVSRGEVKVQHDYAGMTAEQRMRWAYQVLQQARAVLEAPEPEAPLLEGEAREVGEAAPSEPPKGDQVGE